MGKNLNGLFLNLQRITSLGGLGDLGMGGVVNIRTSRLLGSGKEVELKDFLTAARAIFFLMVVLATVISWIALPFLFRALKFEDPQTGSLPMLSLIGGLAAGFVVLNSYITNVNYGCGNTAWPIVPTFLILQFAIFTHWLLARQSAPLWAQYSPYMFAMFLCCALGRFYLKASHPTLATLQRLKFNRKQFADLVGNSFWMYLNSVGTGIWITVDMLLITAQFGPQIIPAYQYNNKLCELVFFFIVSANMMSMPKITRWIASSETASRERGIQELFRVHQFQTFLGCCAALVYLSVNNWFMNLWLGSDFQVPLLWQIAFAANVAVTGAGAMGFELAFRCCDEGIRTGGIASLIAAFLNFGLSLLSLGLSSVVGMNGSIFGIALATAIAQSALHLYLGHFTARQLKISWWKLTVKNWLLAVATMAFAGLIRVTIPQQGALNILFLAIVHLAAFFIIARIAGIGLKDLRHEKIIFKSMFSRQKDSAA